MINMAILLCIATQLHGNLDKRGVEVTRAKRTNQTGHHYVPITPFLTPFRKLEESTSKPSTHSPPQPTVIANNTLDIQSKMLVLKNYFLQNLPTNILRLTQDTSETPEQKPLHQLVPTIIDERSLAKTTLAHLKALLKCQDRDFEPRVEQRGEYWVLKNFLRAEHGPLACHESVTYTTHATFEFLSNLEAVAERWLAPISCAIHAPGSDFALALNSIRYYRDCLSSDLVREFVTFHLFFSYKHLPNKIPDPKTILSAPYNCTEKIAASSTYVKARGMMYPVNVARNIARDAAMTHFLLPSDIELYPSPSLPARFLNMIARNAEPLISTNPRVFPISIFEVNSNAQVPWTKTELQAMLAKKTAITFHKYVCPACHSVPKSQQWVNERETIQMKVFHVAKRKGDFMHWEPFYIGTHSDPHYDERLCWEGKQDKMQQGYLLCVLDYDFMILNNAFLVHKPGIKRNAGNERHNNIVFKQGKFVENTIMRESARSGYTE